MACTITRTHSRQYRHETQCFFMDEFLPHQPIIIGGFFGTRYKRTNTSASSFPEALLSLLIPKVACLQNKCGPSTGPRCTPPHPQPMLEWHLICSRWHYRRISE